MMFLAVVVVCLIVVTRALESDQGPPRALTPSQRKQALGVADVALNSGGLQEVASAAQVFALLGSKPAAAAKTRACDLAVSAVGDAGKTQSNVLLAATRVLNGLKCEGSAKQASSTAKKTAETMLDAAVNVNEDAREFNAIYEPAAALLELLELGAGSVPESLPYAIQAMVVLEDQDGFFKLKATDDAGSLLATGRALSLFAGLATRKAAGAHASDLEDVADHLEFLLAMAETGNRGAISFLDLEDQPVDSPDNVAATAAVAAGVAAFARAVPKAAKQLAGLAGPDHVVGLASFLVGTAPAQLATVAGAADVLVGLAAVAEHPLGSPLVVSLDTAALRADGADGRSVRVAVTNVLGDFASKCSVKLSNAAGGSLLKGEPVTLSPVSGGDGTLYEAAVLPEAATPGFYPLAVAVQPDAGSAKKSKQQFIGVKRATRALKVVAAVKVLDASVAVRASSSADADAVRTEKLKFGQGAVSLSLANGQAARLEFRVVSTGSDQRGVQVHQSFVRVASATREVTVLAELSDAERGLYAADLTLDTLGDGLHFVNGAYQAELLLGDSLLIESIQWPVLDLSLDFGDKARADDEATQRRGQPHRPEGSLPLIEHVFRTPDSRPPAFVSKTFTLLVLAPIAVFFLGLLRVGANANGFGQGGASAFVNNVGFHACIGSYIFLFVLYFTRLNIIQTLQYSGLLFLPTFYFGFSSLRTKALQSPQAATPIAPSTVGGDAISKKNQ